MADSRITDLTSGNPAQSGDEIPINRSGADRKITAGSIAALAAGEVPNSRQIISGAGLTGGGTLAADRTLAVGAGTGITVNADDVAIGDAELLALAGLTSAANKIPRFTGSGTADLLDFKDEDDMVSDSATAIPSQQSVKAYVDATSSSGTLPDGDKGDITVSGSGIVWTIDADVVTNAKAANMAESTVKGRAVGAGTGDPTDLTATQVRTLINVEDGSTNDQTAAEILAALLTVDGAGSGLDADLLDGVSSASFIQSSRQIISGGGLTGGGDLSADRTLVVGAGTGITVNADDVALDTASTRNTDHSGVTLTAGGGLTGGGDISASRTFDVVAGTGITVNANDVALTIPVAVSSGGTGQTTEAEAIGELIQALTEDTSPDMSADYLGSYDASADTGKKVLLSRIARERLSASRTYYVRTDGNDSNTGLVNNAGGAFLTIQYAVNVVGELDFNNDDDVAVTIQIGAGTYSPGADITLPALINMRNAFGAVILGDETTPANVTINAGFDAGGQGSIWFIAGVKINTTGQCLHASYHAQINAQNIYFTGSGSTRCCRADLYGNIFLDTNHPGLSATRDITVDGDIRCFAAANYHGTVDAVFDDLILLNTPAITEEWLGVGELGLVYWLVGGTTTGSATGLKFYCRLGGVIQDYGGAAPPGDVEGILAGTGSFNSNNVGSVGTLVPNRDSLYSIGDSTHTWLDAFIDTIELGHASDTTLSRAAAGAVAVEGVRVAMCGKQTIWIPAGSLTPRGTAGVTIASRETNGITVGTANFPDGSDSGANFHVAFPKSWNAGTVTYQVAWTAASGSGTAEFELRGGCFANDAAINTSGLGTAVAVSDTLLAANDVHWTSESSAVTLSNDDDDTLAIFEIIRDVSDDTLAVDVELLGIKLFYTTDAGNDA